MSDLDPGYAQRQAERERAYNEACAEYRRTDPIARQAATAKCTLCDEDGYRPNGLICDHVDRTETHARGIAACRAALTKGSNQ